ncbi:DNA-directed RNA polymerase I subunit RPA34.5-domain-containing protein [Morchella snyderi]|nr:DNA-directed RNA polymerase I subunit RPA34.5-domain-containing protein [Morchella snyderi]
MSQERVVDSESESVSGSESEEEEEEEEEETQRSTATTTTTAAAETEGDSESGSDETASESESGSEDEEEEEEEGEELASSAKRPKGSYKYAPPPEFKLVPPGGGGGGGGGGSNPFSAANLNGKELWLITAPLAAPLSKVDRISPADIAEGLPVLMTGSGRSYCLRTKEEGEEEGGEVGLFVPDGRGGYKLAGKKISKNFQMVEALPTGREVTEEMVKSKPVKQQPEGLKMRFKPIGFEGEMEADGNVEMRDVSLEVRPTREAARGDGEHKMKKRRTHDEKEERREKKHRRRNKE